MRLMIERSKQLQGTDTLYVLLCRIEVTSTERPALMAALAHWSMDLVKLGIDRDTLVRSGYRAQSTDVRAVQEQEQALRAIFEGLVDYFDAARSYGGSDVHEADIS